MKQFKIGVAVVCLFVGLFALVASSLPEPSPSPKRGTRQLLRRVKTAQTVGSQSVDVAVFDVPDNSVMHIQVRVLAIELLSGKAKTWNIQGGFKRFNGILSLIATDVDIEFEAGDPITGQWEGSIEFDDVTDEMCVRFKGRANQTIEWMADFEIDLYQP